MYNTSGSRLTWLNGAKNMNILTMLAGKDKAGQAVNLGLTQMIIESSKKQELNNADILLIIDIERDWKN